jgi:hypothetical protein
MLKPLPGGDVMYSALRKMTLTAETRRKLTDIVNDNVPITWELLEDMGLFCVFKQLPTQEDLKLLLHKESFAETC